MEMTEGLNFYIANAEIHGEKKVKSILNLLSLYLFRYKITPIKPDYKAHVNKALLLAAR